MLMVDVDVDVDGVGDEDVRDHGRGVWMDEGESMRPGGPSTRLWRPGLPSSHAWSPHRFHAPGGPWGAPGVPDPRQPRRRTHRTPTDGPAQPGGHRGTAVHHADPPDTHGHEKKGPGDSAMELD